MASEEKDHAVCLRELSEHLNPSDSFTQVSPYCYKILNYTKHFLDRHIKNVQRKKMGRRRAIIVAIRLELSMLERKSFDIFVPASEEIKNVMIRLNNETEEHADRLWQMLSRIK